MTKETKKAAKADIFRGYREKAVSRFNEYMPEDGKIEDTWEGVMNAIDYILDRADRDGERSGTILTAAMWMHGYLEEDTAERLCKLRELVDGEVEAALAEHSSADKSAQRMMHTAKSEPVPAK